MEVVVISTIVSAACTIFCFAEHRFNRISAGLLVFGAFLIGFSWGGLLS